MSWLQKSHKLQGQYLKLFVISVGSSVVTMYHLVGDVDGEEGFIPVAVLQL